MTEANIPGSTAESQRPSLGPTTAIPTPAPAAGGVIQYGPPPSYDAQGRLRAPDEAAYYDLTSYSAPHPNSPDPNSPYRNSVYSDSVSWKAYYPNSSEPGSPDYDSAADPVGLPPTTAGPATLPAGRRGNQEPAVERRGRGRRPNASAVVGLLALVTAALAGLAPWLTFWIGEYGSGDPGDVPGHFHVNGFGHTFYGTVLDASSPAGAHDTDYGVPLLAAAVVLAVAAVTLVTPLRRMVVGLLLAVVGGALSAGVAVEGLMDRGARFSLDDVHDHWSVGAGWWLMATAGIGGAVLALVAAVLVARLTRSPAAALTAAQESPAGGAPDLAGDWSGTQSHTRSGV